MTMIGARRAFWYGTTNQNPGDATRATNYYCNNDHVA